MNTVILMGRLAADPELKTTASGTSVLAFTVCTDKWVPKGEEKKTDFIPCIAWKGTAEHIARYFAKGDMIAIEGSLSSRNYEDKNGNKRTAYEVITNKCHFCGGKKESQPKRQTLNVTVADDDLPF